MQLIRELSQTYFKHTMIKDSYDYFPSANKTLYFFESEGSQGKIHKVIIFTYAGKNLWNLAFGDLKNADIDDSVISNNHDIVKLISTIAKAVYEFSAEFLQESLLLDPLMKNAKNCIITFFVAIMNPLT